MSDSEETIPIKDEYDIVVARSAGKTISSKCGFGLVDQTRISTAISELARNILVYAVTGTVYIREVDADGKHGIEVVAEDHGPGIANLDLAMTDGHTTGGGLGAGLPGTKRLMDEFEIVTAVGEGTTVTVRKWV
ncbi:MAG: anti-sigma regulatory factor [Euryarchaeota archaeon]|nr:anti-sigma regulatory factor [Euryarchaeota archaeon]